MTQSVLFVNSKLHFTKLRASKASPGAYTVARDLYMRFEREREREREGEREGGKERAIGA
jgi:hypothetical protein